jgi:hypothetical protein
MVHVNPNVVISMGKWLKSHKTPTTQPFSFIFVAMIFFLIRILYHKKIPDWCSG